MMLEFQQDVQIKRYTGNWVMFLPVAAMIAWFSTNSKMLFIYVAGVNNRQAVAKVI